MPLIVIIALSPWIMQFIYDIVKAKRYHRLTHKLIKLVEALSGIVKSLTVSSIKPFDILLPKNLSRKKVL